MDRVGAEEVAVPAAVLDAVAPAEEVQAVLVAEALVVRAEEVQVVRAAVVQVDPAGVVVALPAVGAEVALLVSR